MRHSIAGLAALLALSLAMGSSALGAGAPVSKPPSAPPAKAAPRAKPAPRPKLAPRVAPALQTYRYTADLEQTAERQGSVSAAGVRWSCKGRRCTTQAPWPAPEVNACRALVKLVGKVRSYGHAASKLSRSQVRQCNASVGMVAKKKVSAEAGPPPPARTARQEVRGTRRALPLWGVPEEEMRVAATRALPEPDASSQGDDCDDSDPTVHPNQPESRCDGVDDNCNGEIDEGLRIMAYRDRDHDLFGDPESGFLACPRDVVGELTDNNFDCDDSDPTVNPPAGNCP